MKSENYFKTSDIKIHRDCAGFYNAEHKYQGLLIDSSIYETRADCRRDAVIILNEIKDNE